MGEPRVLHFHDCAGVGAALVRAAARQSLHWDYLSADAVRPPHPHHPYFAAAHQMALLPRNSLAVQRCDVLHVHFGTALAQAQNLFTPKRPYFLHLHGTDIRVHWKREQKNGKSTLQRAIDQAVKVYYTSIDTRENAETARSDAEFMPAFIEPDSLAPWQYSATQQPTIVFVSRWEDIKGASANIELAAALRSAFPQVRLEGLDWGVAAAQARRAGVHLLPKLSHAQFISWIARATVAIGQACPMLGVSEFEAMAMGIPIGALGHRIPRPNDGQIPPIYGGTIDEMIDQVRIALDDPLAASLAMRADTWALRYHVADPYVPILQSAYRAAAQQAGRIRH
ncbi:glycosyltransferase [Trueperella sp. LYQ141]|uniref:glycosyltransferase n=1 Tax=Trueperella sp. LYQ141 TaxID=3391058 RepID=UPI0039834E28